MLDQYTDFFLVGIKGVAMANIARIFHQMGKAVAGSDSVETFITDPVLTEIKLTPSTNFSPQDLPPITEVVIYSAAHDGAENPQVKDAKKRGLLVVHQAAILGELIQKYQQSVAVCGCHGKTTTASLLAYAMINLQVSPGYLVGTSQFSGFFGGELGKKDYFVLEADEYALHPPGDRTSKLEHYQPTQILCTNIDYDHPDVYANLEETKRAFLRFFQKIPLDRVPRLFLCQDDANLQGVAQKLPVQSYLTFGLSDQSDLKITDVKNDEHETKFKLETSSAKALRFLPKISRIFSIGLFGEKNVSNAAGAILVLLSLGFAEYKIEKAIRLFSGAKRRFEKVEESDSMTLFDDYAHHPHEISATIEAARRRFPHRRLVIIFQPHTFSRTLSLKTEFLEALSHADLALIAPIFPSARESYPQPPITAGDLEELARKAGKTNVFGYDSNNKLVDAVSIMHRPGDVIFTMGAGDIYKLKDRLKAV